MNGLESIVVHLNLLTFDKPRNITTDSVSMSLRERRIPVISVIPSKMSAGILEVPLPVRLKIPAVVGHEPARVTSPVIFPENVHPPKDTSQGSAAGRAMMLRARTRMKVEVIYDVLNSGTFFWEDKERKNLKKSQYVNMVGPYVGLNL